MRRRHEIGSLCRFVDSSTHDVEVYIIYEFVKGTGDSLVEKDSWRILGSAGVDRWNCDVIFNNDEILA